MLFTILITLLLAALSGMGVGGGGLFVIYLAIFTDTPQLTAQGMNLLFFLLSSGASATVHLKRRSICFPAVGVMAAFGILGALIGASLSARVPQHLLRQIFGGMLVVSGTVSLMKKESAPPKPSPEGEGG